MAIEFLGKTERKPFLHYNGNEGNLFLSKMSGELKFDWMDACMIEKSLGKKFRGGQKFSIPLMKLTL